MNKYTPLLDYLRQQPGTDLVLSFEQIEEIVGGSLPASAYSASWWASEKLGFWAARHPGHPWAHPEIVASLLPGSDQVRFRRVAATRVAADVPRGRPAPPSAVTQSDAA